MSHEGIRISAREDIARDAADDLELSRAAVTPAKVRVLLTEGKGLEIDWSDGHRSAWNFAWLRHACPCATCVDERQQQGRKPGLPKPRAADPLPMYTPPAKPASAHSVGRYAIQFNWLDGHNSGIYSFNYLRRHCQCGECRFARGETTGSTN
ncbi:MAG TPA: DUF971 domain-containing protein [Terracidiphilus sp.]|jgi:DUF971 family protein